MSKVSDNKIERADYYILFPIPQFPFFQVILALIAIPFS